MTSEKALAELLDILNDIISTNPTSKMRINTIYRNLLNEYFTAERCISFVALYKDIAPAQHNLCAKREVKKLLDKIEEAIG